MITDRIGRHKVLLPINHESYNFREKKNSQDMKERENKFELKDAKEAHIVWCRSDIYWPQSKWMWLVDFNCNFNVVGVLNCLITTELGEWISVKKEFLNQSPL